jgi:hypothetical protein
MKSIKTMLGGIGFLILFLCGNVFTHDAKHNFLWVLTMMSLFIGMIAFFRGLLIKVDGTESADLEDDDMDQNNPYEE